MSNFIKSNGTIPIACSLIWRDPFEGSIPIRKVGEPSNVQMEIQIGGQGVYIDPNAIIEFQLVNFILNGFVIYNESAWIPINIGIDGVGRFSLFDTTIIDDKFKPGLWRVAIRIRDQFGGSLQQDCSGGQFKIVSATTISEPAPQPILTCPPGTRIIPQSPQVGCQPIVTDTTAPPAGNGRVIIPTPTCDSPCRVEGDFCRCPEVVPVPTPIPVPIKPRKGIPRERLPIKAEISPFAVIGSAALFLFFLATRRRKGR